MCPAQSGGAPCPVKSHGNYIMNISVDSPELEIMYLPLQSCCYFKFSSRFVNTFNETRRLQGKVSFYETVLCLL